MEQRAQERQLELLMLKADEVTPRLKVKSYEDLN